MNKELEARLNAVEEVLPDDTDLAMSQAAALESEEDYVDGREFIAKLEEYRGKISLRIPKTLHRQLAINAQMDGVSLNQYIVFLLARGVGA